MSKRFRAGMVGAGNICEFHVAAVKALPDVELIGVTDTDRKRGQVNGEKWGTIYFNSLEQMVEAGANVIHVLTPPATHAKIAKAALQLGCHVLIEKPVTEDEKDALEIARLALQ
jgi:predicted dehydrogenase